MNKQIEEMALEDAISHARDTANTREDLCEECRKEHAQLADWLEELKQYRSKGYRKQSEGGAECPVCHGTGQIGTTDWLTRHISKKKLAEEKAKAIADVVEVVRCKDCTEWDEKAQECSHWYGFRDNDFCSYGKRRTDNELH